MNENKQVGIELLTSLYTHSGQKDFREREKMGIEDIAEIEGISG